MIRDSRYELKEGSYGLANVAPTVAASCWDIEPPPHAGRHRMSSVIRWGKSPLLCFWQISVK